MRKLLFRVFALVFIILCGLGFYCIYTLSGSSTNDVILSPDPINVLVLIKDRHSGLTDSIMLFNYNPDENNVSMLSIPRDTAVTIDGSTHKINSVYGRAGETESGGRLVCKYVNELTNIKVNKFFLADLNVVRDVVDAVGGVDFKVPIRMKYRDKSQNLFINLKRGMQHLNGEQVEQMLRYRHPNTNAKKPKNYEKFYDGGDLKRTEMQMKFLRAFFKQKVSILNIGSITDVLNSVVKNAETNLSKDEMLRTVSKSSTLTSAKYFTYRLNGTGYSYYTYDGNFIDTKQNKTFPGTQIVGEHFVVNKTKSN